MSDLLMVTEFKANTVITREGDGIEGKIYVITEGKAEVYNNYGKIGQHIIGELSAGDYFGEMKFFLNVDNEGAVVSRTDLKAIEITRDSIYDFFGYYPESTYLLLQSLCARLKNLEGKYTSLQRLSYQREPEADEPEEVFAAAPEEISIQAEPEEPEERPIPSLFPSGHKRYILPEYELKENILRDEALTCPICGNKFNFPVIRTVVARVLSTDYDLRKNYDGVNGVCYLTATCQVCLYSGITDKFEAIPKSAKNRILEAMAPYMEELDFSFDNMDADTIFTRLYLALICAPFCYDDAIMSIARLWINISWLYRDCGDGEMEKYAMLQALQAYTTIYTDVKMNKKSEQALCMILGELNFRLGNEENAKRFFFEVRTNTEGDKNLTNKAEDRLFDIKELKQEK